MSLQQKKQTNKNKTEILQGDIANTYTMEIHHYTLECVLTLPPPQVNSSPLSAICLVKTILIHKHALRFMVLEDSQSARSAHHFSLRRKHGFIDVQSQQHDFHNFLHTDWFTKLFLSHLYDNL